MRLKGWTKLSAEQLWATWRELFDSEAEAVATAIWCANRLIKSSQSRSTRRIFYEIKDQFIHLYGREGEGQLVRHEVSECWGCDGDDPFCDRCDGSGVYRERWLYVHRFEVEGRPYCFHSYQEPAHLVAGIGEDAESFGGRFTETELKQLALPMSGLVQMLRYVAAVVWPGKQARVKVPQRSNQSYSVRYFWVGDPEGEPY